MNYRAARPVEPEVARVQSGDSYQLLPDPIYPPLDNGHIDRLRNCLIIQGILIAVLFAAFVVLVLSFGVVLSIFHSPVNTNSSASHQTIPTETIRTCILETAYCHFSTSTIGETCRTTPLSTNATV